MQGPARGQRAAATLPLERVRLLWIFGLASAGLAIGALTFAACGGTTGRPDMAAPGAADAGGLADVTAEGAADAAGGDDSAEQFDTTIQYADRVLPDVEAVGDGGFEAGSLMLNCPPDLQAITLQDGSVVPVDAGNASLGSQEIAATYASGGTQVPAGPGSPCATQVWTTSAACDACLRTTDWGNAGWVGEVAPAELPPCSDMADAGTAHVGPGNGMLRSQLCVELFNCMMQHQCFWGTAGPAGCMCNEGQNYCVMNGGDGVCFQQELAAFEAPPGTSYVTLLNELTKSFPRTRRGTRPRQPTSSCPTWPTTADRSANQPTRGCPMDIDPGCQGGSS